MGESTKKPFVRSSSSQRAAVVKHIAIAIMWLLCYLALAYKFFPDPNGDFSDPASRLIYALRWLVLPYALMQAMIQHTANRRLGTSAIDPTDVKGQDPVLVPNRVLGNTHESLFIHTLFLCVLSTYLPAQWMKAVPILVLGMLQGRVAFWIGFEMGPLLRAFGMALTFGVNFVTILSSLYFVLTLGFDGAL